jgi:hypothetical protein
MRTGTIQKPSALGSTAVSATDGYWYVSEEESGLVVGQVVHKVGINTGWTSGTILNTCIDRWMSGWHSLLCGYAANYDSDGGDSGGPVFLYDPGECDRCVILAGMHSGHGPPSFNSVFSKLTRIKSDLGGTWNFLFTPGLQSTTLNGNAQNGYASLSWSSVAGAVRYEVFRGYGAGTFLTRTSETGTGFNDYGESVLEVLSGGPPFGVPVVGYYVIAYSGSDLSLGSNIVYFRTPPAGPTISVTLNGPDEVLPSAGCYWQATAGGGTGSYTYVWKVNGTTVGSNSSLLYYTNSGASFTVSVDVTDGSSNPGFANRWVTVSGNASWCDMP